jgi:hypothetical protein
LNDARIARIGARLQEVARDIRDQLTLPVASS